jgi:thioredoxin reductase
MITVNVFNVWTAGDAGSRHAAHAAASAVSHKRIAAKTTRPWIEALTR